MFKMKIRDYRPEDLEKILEFKRKSAKYSFPDRGINLDRFKRIFIKRLEKGKGAAKMLEEDGKVIGYAWFTVKKLTTGKVGVVNHIFVDEPYRGQGLGDKLMQEAEKFFKDREMERVRVTITKGNQRSFKFCKKHGFKEKRVIMEKKLGKE